MNLKRLEAHEIDVVWPDLLTFILSACESSGDRYRAGDVLDFARRGIWQIWVIRNDQENVVFVGATEILDYPTGLRALAWRIGVGSGLEDWKHMMADILAQAKEVGCTIAEGNFRVGWRRVLRDWKHTHEFLERDL